MFTSRISIQQKVLSRPDDGLFSLQTLPTCVLVLAGEGGLRVDSVAIGHQIRALDKRGLVSH